ncbi:hypothetical protein GCM10009612_29470 [Streptomyces beijiangensis]
MRWETSPLRHPGCKPLPDRTVLRGIRFPLALGMQPAMLEPPRVKWWVSVIANGTFTPARDQPARVRLGLTRACMREAATRGMTRRISGSRRVNIFRFHMKSDR